jgi:hypothetical protein
MSRPSNDDDGRHHYHSRSSCRAQRCRTTTKTFADDFTIEIAVTMLSAFTARPIVELKQRDKSKIESILAYGMKADRSSL